MRLCGYQPQYFPRLHYLNRVMNSDVFEISDYVQFVRKHIYVQENGERKRDKSYQAHSPIKLTQGKFLLSIPTKGDLLPISEIQIDYSKDWVRKHLKSIEIGYCKSPNFLKYFSEIKAILEDEYNNLADLTIKTVFWGIIKLFTDEKLPVRDLNIEYLNNLVNKNRILRLKKIFIASESSVSAPSKGASNKWIIELCKYSNADEYYYGGTSHSSYMDVELFKKNGIRTILQDWKCPVYPQLHMNLGFIPNMSIIDLVMNTDLEQRQKIIKDQHEVLAINI